MLMVGFFGGGGWWVIEFFVNSALLAKCISRGLKPGLVVLLDVRAKARTYLRSRCNGKSKSVVRG
jgi:hypothetical protein